MAATQPSPELVRGQPPSSADRIIAIRGYFKDVEGPPNQADLHFNKESFPGYCWLFPTGKNQANVGVGMVLDTIPSGNRLKELLNHLIRMMQHCINDLEMLS